MDAVDPKMRDAKADFFKEAEERFARCDQFESQARVRFLNDLRFANGDSDNHWQWEQQLVTSRKNDGKPYLTINKTRQHNLQIVNDARQNKPGIAVRPTGGGSTYSSAQSFAGIMRYIEYHSAAQDIYDSAMNFCVSGGVGYWRVMTEYCNEMSFDQDIRIKHIADPLTVYIDPDAREPDKSDMNYAFLFETKSKDTVKAKFPQYQDSDGSATLGLNPESPFLAGDDVMVCEYYRRTWEPDTLYRTPQGAVMKKSELSEEAQKMMDENPDVMTRPTLNPKVEWFLIVGHSVLDTKVVPGRYVPVVQITGEEIRIEGVLDRKSHTRALKDPQRMYNYWSSASVEYGALQTKTPWVAAAGAMEGYEDVWAKANTENLAFLPYNAYDDNGQKLDPPIRVTPPMSAPVALDGMKVSQMEMMLVSGQYDNQMGQQGNERTGAAINARQRQGDNATYHYINGLAIGVKYTGKIILGMIPTIYDTKRTIMILGQDATTQELQVDPNAKEAYSEQTGADGQPQARFLNPNVGYYEVQADIGPGYGTQRQEAFNALSVMLAQNPALTAIVGDILLRAADFPLADEAAERMKRMVPPAALGTGPTDNEKQLTQQVQNMQGTIQALMDQLVVSQAQILRQQGKTGVDSYGAYTDRIKVLLDSGQSAQELKLAFIQLVADMMQEPAQLAKATAPDTIAQSGIPALAGDLATQRPLAPNGGMIGTRFNG
jgi:hypothetical protein